jgi:hypothetical protein
MSYPEFSYRIRYSISLIPSTPFHPCDVLGMKESVTSISQNYCIVFPTTLLKESDLVAEKSSEFLLNTFFIKYPEYSPAFLQKSRHLTYSYHNYTVKPTDRYRDLLPHSRESSKERVDYIPLDVHFQKDL